MVLALIVTGCWDGGSPPITQLSLRIAMCVCRCVCVWIYVLVCDFDHVHAYGWLSVSHLEIIREALTSPWGEAGARNRGKTRRRALLLQGKRGRFYFVWVIFGFIGWLTVNSHGDVTLGTNMLSRCAIDTICHTLGNTHSFSIVILCGVVHLCVCLSCCCGKEAGRHSINWLPSYICRWATSVI